jgi:hypothetical protein
VAVIMVEWDNGGSDVHIANCRLLRSLNKQRTNVLIVEGRMEERWVNRGRCGANCDLLICNKSALPKFLVGRQIVVASLMFTAGRVVSVDAGHPEVGAGRTSVDVGADFQTFLNLNFCGALITTIIGSLVWRIIASSYSLLFMSNPVIYILI